MICLSDGGDIGDGSWNAIYLKVVQTANMSEGWSRDVKLKFLVFNQVNTNMTITKGSYFNCLEVLLSFFFSRNLIES
jgi:hypothetical protein